MAATDEAISAIKRMINSGELSPGYRLPRESDLARAIGVSRNSLREAVSALSMVQILDVRQGDGTYVSRLDPDSLMESISFLLDFRRDSSVLDVLELRRILEPAAAALAARRMSEDRIGDLRQLLEGTRHTDSISSLVHSDLEFHAAIASGSGNSMLASMVNTVSMPTVRARIWRGLTQHDAVARTMAEHEAIVEAIEHHDAELAEAHALVHVSGVLEWVSHARGDS